LKHRFGNKPWGIAINVMVLVFVLCPPSRAATSAAIVNTNQGPVRGMVQGNVRVFLGIPYAKPPVGQLRWRPPQPHPKWTTTLDATRAGNECPQMNFSGQVEGSEDCLYLNIYTPNPPAANLPVMVWIHGGTFLVGSGALYSGARLAAKGKLVVVTINYRLGPLGFLAHPSLDAENPHHVSGNYGLLDQQAAMLWVKNNIRAFGGNPNNITIAGESAGAISVGLQMISPKAKGLFERAIMESGPFLPQRMLKQAEVRGIKFAHKLGCKTADAAACMRSKDTAEIITAMPASPTGPLVWAPVMDGEVLPRQPAEAIASGHFTKVPVINGSNRDEGTLFIAFLPPISAAEYTSAVHGRFGTNADKVLAAYPLDHYASPQQATAAQFGDSIFSCSIIGASGVLAKFVPVYAYEFNDRRAPLAPWMPKTSLPYGAYHSAEIQYVLGDEQGMSPAQRKLSDEMMGYWSEFISSGDPGTHSPRWTRFHRSEDRVLSLAPGKIAYETDFATRHHCGLWWALAPDHSLAYAENHPRTHPPAAK
jgi:para-nitrobenzyl esterase